LREFVLEFTCVFASPLFSRYNLDFVRACDCMNEAIQLLENQGDPLSSALALKYALATAFRFSISRGSHYAADTCAPYVRTGRTGPASAMLPRCACHISTHPHIHLLVFAAHDSKCEVVRGRGTGGTRVRRSHSTSAIIFLTLTQIPARRRLCLQPQQPGSCNQLLHICKGQAEAVERSGWAGRGTYPYYHNFACTVILLPVLS
jgi:hypothetical protein